MIDREVMRFAVRQMLRTRKFHFALLVSLIPLLAGIIMFGVEMAQQSEPGYQFAAGQSMTVAFVVLGGTVPFVALLLAGGLMADEAEDRTLSYLLVRPIRRSTLYLSKALPIIGTTAALAAAQALGLGIMRLAAFAVFGSGTVEPTAPPPGELAGTISSGVLLLITLPVSAVAAALVGAVLAAVFGFVSIVTTRFHFLANLLIFLVWELPFSRLGGVPGFMTASFHGLSLMDRVDPTLREDLAGGPAHPAVAVVWLVVWLGVWLWAGTNVVSRRGFHVTSAAS